MLLLLLSPEAALSQPVVTNVGIDASLGFVLDGGFVALRTSEARTARTDLNGDGDATDFVLHIYNTHSGVLTNTHLEISGLLEISNGFVAWPVSEALQGMTDLNGDGDTMDRVLHVVNAATGAVTNLGLATNCQNTSTSRECTLEGSTLAFVVDELAQGGKDLNGDGDAVDDVLHVYDVVSGNLTNVGLEASGGFDVDGGRVAFGVREVNQGGTSLNGDLDTNDVVLHVFDGSLPATNLATVTSDLAFRMAGDLLGVAVVESGNSLAPTDLNLDGDTLDSVVQAFDLAANVWTNLGLAIEDSDDFQVDAGLIAVAMSEVQQGVSVNGDSDPFDKVLHVFDSSDGHIRNLAFAVTSFQLDGSRLAFGVDEIGQGFTDINGDGDFLDVVLHLFDNTTAMTENLLTDASMGFKLDGDMLLGFAASEANQGGADQNGDGDALDATLYIFDIDSGNLLNVQADPIGGFQTFQLDGKAVSFGVNEATQGPADLNGDGDADDVVLHLFDVATGVTTNLGFDVTLGHQFQDGKIAFIVMEQKQGMTDLNGDGDAFDVVLHIADVNPEASPSDRIDDLIAHVRSLGLPRRIERSRVVFLRLAQRALDRGQTRLAIRFLRIFRFLVRIRAGHGIPKAEARALIQETNEIIRTLRS